MTELRLKETFYRLTRYMRLSSDSLSRSGHVTTTLHETYFDFIQTPVQLVEDESNLSIDNVMMLSFCDKSPI